MASLIEAVHSGDVGEVAERALAAGTLATGTLGAGDPADEIHRRVVAACRSIGAELDTTEATVLARLRAVGIDAGATPRPRLPQRRTVQLRVTDHAVAEQAATALGADGFERWETWTGATRRSFARHADHLTVARTDDATTVVRVAWREATTRTRRQRITTPTIGDWQMVTLPTWAWSAYPMVRVVRLAAERTGLRRRHEATLGPFLATPASLLAPLLHEADVTPDDVVLDLGCGDGRLPVTAALAGSRAVGIERSAALADRARRRAVAAAVADRVTIVTGDAREADLDPIDVVFAFLPTDVLADLLPSILSGLRPGGRVIAHEQNRLPDHVHPRPTRSTVVASGDALTVAHRWDV